MWSSVSLLDYFPDRKHNYVENIDYLAKVTLGV